MSLHGGDDEVLVRARCALLDALEALEEHRANVILVGAQAIYLHTGAASIALAEYTTDADFALDPRDLADNPLIQAAMWNAGFRPNLVSDQPGAWISARGVEVDLMVPEGLANSKGRSVRIGPHDKRSARSTAGLEAAVVDHAPQPIPALGAGDDRMYVANVAGPAALLVAKLHKVAERLGANRYLDDKDAHDVYRLLFAVDPAEIEGGVRRLFADEVSRPATELAMTYLQESFAAGPTAPGSLRAGRAEVLAGNPETVSASVAFLAGDLIAALAK
jgi:hypothetical protein